jgi:hypothetical protein
MTKYNVPPEQEEDFHSKELRSIDDKFDLFLKENDVHYNKKIIFQVSYNTFEDFYKISILPAEKDFDSKKYFMFYFETKKGQERLEKFQRENSVSIITY